MTAAQRRLDRLKALLAHVRERLQIALGFALWDGSTVPHDLPARAFALAIADEGAVAALIRRPKIDTLLDLFAAGRLELRNGTLFDLMAQRPRVRTKDFLKALDKKLAFGTAAQFLFVSRGGPWPLEDIRGGKAPRDGIEAANRAPRGCGTIACCRTAPPPSARSGRRRPAMAHVSGRRLDRIRSRPRGRVPDACVQAQARRRRRAAVARRSLPPASFGRDCHGADREEHPRHRVTMSRRGGPGGGRRGDP
jgi:hypothetical protein